MFMTQETFSRLQKSRYLEVKTFVFFQKGLVHDFDQKFAVSLPLLFSAKLIKKRLWQYS